MFKNPRLEEVMQVAERLGLSLGVGEAETIQHNLVDQLELLDKFVQSRDMVQHPRDQVCRNQEPGYRPTAAEDPLNAWLWRCDIRSEDATGVLSGKSVSFKDTIPVAGLPVTFGSFSMDGWLADVDATVVTRVLRAGARIVGKNSCSGFSGGLGNGGRLGDYYRPVNPRAEARIPGSSSTGSAVAVAAGEVDISFGGDQGGSVRMPAACCGVVGLKPTFGLVPHTAVASTFDQSLDHIGPIGRTVVDVAIALEAVAGYDGGLDPRQSREIPDRIDVVTHLEDGVDGLRVGILSEGFVGVDEDVRRAVEAAVEVLRARGAVVEEVSVPAHDHVLDAYTALMTEGALALRAAGPFGAFVPTWHPERLTAALNRVWRDESDRLSPRSRAELVLAELSRQIFRGRVYAKAQNLRQAYAAAYDHAFTEVDVLAMPTLPSAPPPMTDDLDVDRVTAVQQSLRVGLPARIRNTAPFNYTGHPAVAMPCDQPGALPISLQLVGRRLEEATVLRVARAYERARGKAVEDFPVGVPSRGTPG